MVILHIAVLEYNSQSFIIQSHVIRPAVYFLQVEYFIEISRLYVFTTISTFDGTAIPN